MRLFLKCSLVLLTAMLVGCKEEVGEVQETSMSTPEYTNPMSLEDEWVRYGLGDPFIMKFNGIYYLYTSTRDSDTGIKVWSSINLVEWDYEGIVADESTTKAAYAPEVFYLDGKFYMYTSPAGNGHYVLQSDSPTGPFEVVTGNMAKSIDGSVFVDDDGTMYFSHAGVNGIEVSKMMIPTVMGPSTVTNAYMDGWTEGSTIFKRHGKYYMTYTGNHVFNDAYRIDYAVSDDPIKNYVPATQNPIILDSEGPTVGLGHNSIVRGPDLDTDYIVYHNLEGPGIIGPLRHMNIDRMAWNGEELLVLGPTSTEQSGPIRPAFEDWFKQDSLNSKWNVIDGKWKVEENYLVQTTNNSKKPQMILSEKLTEDFYTAEYHFKMTSPNNGESLVGAVFSYQDEENYGVVAIDTANNTFQTRFTINGEDGEWEVTKLSKDFDTSYLHQIRVEKAIDGYRFYIDNMLKQTSEVSLASGKIGYFTKNAQAVFGYTAFSNLVDGSGVFDAYKPVPGTIQAVHYQSQEASGQSIVYRADEPIEIIQTDNGRFYVDLSQGDELSYRINVAEAGEYYVNFRMKAETDLANIQLLVDDHELEEPIEIAKSSDWTTTTSNSFSLTEGKHEVSVRLLSGEASFDEMTFFQADELTSLADNFEGSMVLEWSMFETRWRIENRKFSASDSNYSKVTVGEKGWTDYSVEVNVELTEKEGQAGLIIRSVNPADGRELNQNNENFIQGYYAFLTKEGVTLRKQNYGYEDLQHVSIPIEIEKAYRMKVEAVGSVISVYLNNMETPIIEYDDGANRPFSHGRPGLATQNNQALFSEFKIVPSNQ